MCLILTHQSLSQPKQIKLELKSQTLLYSVAGAVQIAIFNFKRETT